MKFLKLILFLIFAVTLAIPLSSNSIFNDNLSEEDLEIINSGEVLIKNIKKDKYISLNKDSSSLSEYLLNQFEELNPKYLAEIITTKPYIGNEDLPSKLEELLYNVSEYTNIPYWSEHNKRWVKLYQSAEIEKVEENSKSINIYADLYMVLFGIVNEKFELTKSEDSVLFLATNIEPINYENTSIELVKENKMQMAILLFREDENWVLYGIGGVNAPRFPFFTSRIETAFLGRIKSFCNFIFSIL